MIYKTINVSNTFCKIRHKLLDSKIFYRFYFLTRHGTIPTSPSPTIIISKATRSYEGRRSSDERRSYRDGTAEERRRWRRKGTSAPDGATELDRRTDVVPVPYSVHTGHTGQPEP